MGFRKTTHTSHPRGVAEISEGESDLDHKRLVNKYCEAEIKVDILKGRIWMVATASAAAAMIQVSGLFIVVDSELILNELSFYRSQLCLPTLGSSDFLKLSVATQGRIRELSIQSTAQLYALLTPYALESSIEEYVRFVPFVGSALAGGLSFAATFAALRGCLQKVEEASLAVIKKSAEKESEDLKFYRACDRGISIRYNSNKNSE